MLGLGWSLFARRYWGNRGCFLLLQVLRCLLRAIRLVLPFLSFGGAERERTAAPLLAKQVLSQLSYSPSLSGTLRTKAGRQVDQIAHARFQSVQYTFPPRQSCEEARPT